MKTESPEQVLTLANFFELRDFPYASLFDGADYPWAALGKIRKFLDHQAFGACYRNAQVHSTAVIGENVLISSGCKVGPFAVIEGPAMFGRNCEIRAHAYVRENVICGEHCVIGHASEVKNAIFLNHANAPHFNYVGDTILGNNVNLGAGAKCANLRFDEASVLVRVDGFKVDTKRRKFGAIIGDGTKFGCTVITDPGTVMGRGVKIGSSTRIGGYIPSGAEINTLAFHYDRYQAQKFKDRR